VLVHLLASPPAKRSEQATRAFGPAALPGGLARVLSPHIARQTSLSILHLVGVLQLIQEGFVLDAKSGYVGNEFVPSGSSGGVR